MLWFALVLLMFPLSVLYAAPLTLSVDHVQRDLGHASVKVTVIEPHEPCRQHPCTITYVGIPLTTLLNHYFPNTWAGFEGDIHLLAQDGYRGIVEASDVRRFDAYLTFARADAAPFVVDNIEQNQFNVPLSPFYLVWDNLKHPALQKAGASGWPYQVGRIELVSLAQYEPLMVADASGMASAGFKSYKKYCMTCHQIQGIGGRKHPEDMRQLVHNKTRAMLRDWINDPASMKAGATMPPLNQRICNPERGRVIEDIIDYLESLTLTGLDPFEGQNP